MLYDYAIFGMGPSGINLTLELTTLFPNKKIICIEKENIIGGCWRVEWDNNLYTEHAPKVVIVDNISNNFYAFLKKHNFDVNNELINLYGNFFSSKKKIFSTFFKHLNIFDIFKLLKGYLFIRQKMTVSEWCKFNNLSSKACELLNILTILTAGNPNNVLISEIFNSSSSLLSNIKIFKDSEKWLQFIENKIQSNNNITLITNSKLIYMNNKNNKIIYAILDNYQLIYAKEYILTIPIKALYNFLIKQNIVIKNNFGCIKHMKNLVDIGCYYSFGFQLHFDQLIKLNDLIFNKNECKTNWCCTCFNDYNFIIIPISNFSTNYTKDSTIKTVWSCCIVNTTNIIQKRNKTINELSKNEIIEDILNFLPQNIKPKYVTIYDGVTKEDGKWISKDSSFSITEFGIIDFKGYIDNLYSVGLHNTTGTATINKAIKNTNRFIDIKICNVLIIDKIKYLPYIIIGLLLIIIIIFYVYKI
jgi:hypothetical protein